MFLLANSDYYTSDGTFFDFRPFRLPVVARMEGAGRREDQARGKFRVISSRHLNFFVAAVTPVIRDIVWETGTLFATTATQVSANRCIFSFVPIQPPTFPAIVLSSGVWRLLLVAPLDTDSEGISCGIS